MIVIASGLLTLTLAMMPILALRDSVRRWVERGVRDMRGATRPIPDTAPGLRRTPPTNTARPIGIVADWVRPNDYPAGARRRREEGRVRVTLAIDAAGTPTGCSVVLSSGYWSLDNGTCVALMNAARFDRARRGSGGSHEGEVRRWTSPGIRWQLPR